MAFKPLEEETPESTPPCGQHHATTGRLTAENSEKAAAARRPAPKKKALWELDRAQYAFAVGLRQALPQQLGGESVRKLAATSQRFYQLGWDAPSLAAAVTDLYHSLGRPPPSYRPGNPAAWLGWALRQIDHTITPAIRRHEDHASQADTEPCPHDWPGGARISIVTRQPKCPSCRRAY